MPKFKDPFAEKPAREKAPREKKSWREIDAMRDGSAHTGRTPDARDKKEAARVNSGAYQGYKRDLDKVFSGGDLPSYLKELLPKNEERDGRLNLLGTILRAETQADLEAAVAAYRAAYDTFPDDPDLLVKLLDVPEEALQLQVLRQVQAISTVQPLAHKKQFQLKAAGLAMLADDDDLRELAEELAAAWR